MFIKFFTQVKENLFFALEFLGIVAVIFLIAYIVEVMLRRKNQSKEKIFTTKKIALIGMFSAIAGILMSLEIPLFFLPDFYKLDFGDLPALIGSFAFGPMAGVMIEFLKVLIKCLVRGTSSAFVGDLGDFMIGCSFILPASIIYLAKKNKKTALLGCVTGTVVRVIVAMLLNAYYLLPTFAVMYGMEVSTLVGMGTAVNPAITDVMTLLVFAVIPLNIIKAGACSLFTVFTYKTIRKVVHL